ncbi:TetR/AcrR family transcriptional regulator [Patulibacter defluvii]|uniref:TetR/AcrR family transcriptional regulator n=1 Tax=Patulibacter defluvii TaxID=3095358 RepID=UPI002A75AB7C|nr:TetR/AcrR family transcriptional regulator [Patulibacter sp. DM4]
MAPPDSPPVADPADATRAYRRLAVDERRRRLLEAGTELFAEHDYGELSMAQIAKAAGVSKPLLYHYFPTKRDFFVATLADAADDLAERVRPRADLPLHQAAHHSLSAYLEWIDERPKQFRRLLTAAAGESGIRELIDNIRQATVALILATLGHADLERTDPALRAAVLGWLLFVDGAMLVRLELGAPDRERFADQLVETLAGAVRAAGDPDAGDRLLGVGA